MQTIINHKYETLLSHNLYVADSLTLTYIFSTQFVIVVVNCIFLKIIIFMFQMINI